MWSDLLHNADRLEGKKPRALLAYDHNMGGLRVHLNVLRGAVMSDCDAGFMK